MAGELELLSLRTLTHVIGHDNGGMPGRALATPATWTAYSPAIGASLTPVGFNGSATGSYLDIGPLRFFDITGTITTNGMGAGLIRVTLPSVPAFSFNNAIGREIAVVGFMCGGFGFSLTNDLNIFRLSDSSYPGGDGRVISIQGCYRTA